MTKTMKSGSIKVKTTVRAGALNPNHARRQLKVKAGLNVGALNPNHSRGGLVVKSAVKAGMIFNSNHSRLMLA